MSYSYDARRIIGKHNRYTIGSIDSNDNSWQSCHQGIHALQRLFLLVYITVHIIRVDNRYTA